MKYLSIAILSFFSLITKGQQNEDFKQVSDYFTFHKKAIAEDFTNQIKAENNLVNKLLLKSTMEDFAKRLDSTENISYTYALIATKNKEILKRKKIKTPASNKNIKDSDATYPNGFIALRQEIQDLFYFNANNETPTNYEAKVKFIVDVDGTITNVVAEGKDAIFNKQAEIVMYRLKHAFTPQYKDGTPVRSLFKVPIKMTF